MGITLGNGREPGVEVRQDSTAARLNKLRAGVLGANDGIVSVAATVIGVAAATDSVPIIATAGFAALSAGAFSMATGEYISVSTQRDTESAIVERVSAASRGHLDGILDTLVADLRHRGVAPEAAHYFARRQLLPRQQHRADADGSLLVTTHINHVNQLLPVVRFWLPNVRIVKPVEWHAALVEGLRQAMAKWGD